MERMRYANRSVLVGVPAGAFEEGAHRRNEQQQARFNRTRMRVSTRSSMRQNRLALTRAKARARSTAQRLFKAFTFATEDEFRSGPIADAMKRNMSEAAKAAKPRNLRGPTFVAKADSGNIPLAMIAAVHEFGKPELGIPERSFLRGGIRSGIPKFHRLNAANLRAVVLGAKTVAESLEQLGVVAVGEVKREFVVGKFAPNKPATIARKGSSRPLVDTGQLRQSITYQLEGTQSAKAKVFR
jgi:hypothetical protein